MNVIKELQGQEAKIALAQFLGQNIGELKGLDSNIVSGNSTLRGNTININNIGTDIPGYLDQRPHEPQQPQQPQQSQPYQQPIASAVEIPTVFIDSPLRQPVQPVLPPTPKNQFEFNFDLSSKDIFNKLDNIEKQNCKIIKMLESIVSNSSASNQSDLFINDTKKKN